MLPRFMSWPGLTRPSRSGAHSPPKRDCRVKPGNDDEDGVFRRRETLLSCRTQERVGKTAAELHQMLVLGIETTCDETAAAVIERREDGSGRILSNVVHSQIKD